MGRNLGLGLWLAGSLLVVGSACDRFAKEEKVEKSVTVTKADHDKTVKVANGGRVTVRLSWSPGTGYDWVVAKNNTALLQQDGEPATESSKNPMPGAPETRIIHFKALQAGGVPLEFHNRRPWEKDAPPLEVFRVQVMIFD